MSRWTIIALAVAASLACEDQRDPFTPQEATPVPNAEAAPPISLAAGGPSASGLQLPFSDSISDSATAFRIHQTGWGGTGAFLVENSSSSAVALLGQSWGLGPAIYGLATGGGRAGVFEVSNPNSGELALNAKHNGRGTALLAMNASTGRALHAWNTGTGAGGLFELSQSSNTNYALEAKTNGNGAAVRGLSTGSGRAGSFQSTNAASNSTVLEVINPGRGYGGLFWSTCSGSCSPALAAEAAGGTAVSGRSTGPVGPGGYFSVTNVSNPSHALMSVNNGSGYAGYFVGQTPNSKGVYIQTNTGVAGLQVIGGSKNAVVGTTTGARALYTEESSEVWFTDYGFARLQNGRARILIDPTFAETINPDEPYHVFVQPYGEAELYVTERTPLGFVVRLRDGDQSVEFSYRLVAKRRGFERARLERAPWADAATESIRQSR